MRKKIWKALDDLQDLHAFHHLLLRVSAYALLLTIFAFSHFFVVRVVSRLLPALDSNFCTAHTSIFQQKFVQHFCRISDFWIFQRSLLTSSSFFQRIYHFSAQFRWTFVGICGKFGNLKPPPCSSKFPEISGEIQCGNFKNLEIWNLKSKLIPEIWNFPSSKFEMRG